MTALITADRPFIGGEFVAGAGGDVVVHSPATTEAIATVQATDAEQVDRAIAAARRAFDEGPWPTMDPAERIAVIRRLGAAFDARREALVETVIAEAGCPRTVTEVAQVGMALDSFGQLADLYAGMPEWEHNEAPLADHLVGSSVRLSIRRYEAAGVVAAITPYNFPFITNVWKVVPALLAGCTVVLRPSPLTPLQALVFGEVAQEAGLPPGVLNVVVEAGHDAAIALTTDPRVDVVSFTGSSAVGKAVAAQAAPTLKRVILELGGKSVALHLPDVFDQGVGAVIAPALTVFASHAGQGCALQTRVLVPEEHRGAVTEAIAAAVKMLPIGDPAQPSTMIGPLISEAQRDRVAGLVTRSTDAGARLVTGGRAPADIDRGWYYEPTVLDAPAADNPANLNEFFGPVVSVLGYRDLDDAIRIVNTGDYGLSGGIYTGDLHAGLDLAKRFRSGTVQINTGWATAYTPMGGYKQSGYGRERGAAGIRAFQELKHIVVGSR